MKKLTVIGGLICVISFTIYYIQAYYDIGVGAYSKIYSLGTMLGLSVVFLGLAIKETKKAIKHFLFYPISFFFGILFLTYIFNMYFDFFLQTNKMNLSYLITVFICVLCFWLRRLI